MNDREYWAQQRKDGHRQNSSEVPIVDALRVRWARALNNFQIARADVPGSYQRSNNLSIRDGKIAVMVPSGDPKAFSGNFHEYRYAFYGILDLADGKLLSSVMTPHLGTGGIISTSGNMDSDTCSGLNNQYLTKDWTMYTAYGGDGARSFEFDPATGTLIAGSKFGGAFSLANAPNGSGHFTMTDRNPLLWASGGASAHSAYETGIVGISNRIAQGMPSLKMYSSVLLDGSWAYPLTVAAPGSPYGVRISGIEASDTMLTPRWSYADLTKGFLTFGANSGGGALRAYALGQDGRLYYYGYYLAANGQPDYARGMVLVGVSVAGNGLIRTADFEIPIPWNILNDVNASPFMLESRVYPQMATHDYYIVIFQQQQARWANAHLFIIDTLARKLMARIDFPAGYFLTDTNIGPDGQLSPGQAVQMVIAGDSAYIVEPQMVDGALLKLRVERVVLATGTMTSTVLTPLGSNGAPIPVPLSARAVMLRDLAAVDGSLIALIDMDIKDQALVVMDGSAGQQPPTPPSPPPPPPPPLVIPVPTELQTFVKMTGAVVLMWNPTPDAISYTVWRGQSGGPYQAVQRGLTRTNFVDVNLQSGAVYFYVVSASTSAGESGYSNEAGAVVR